MEDVWTHLWSDLNAPVLLEIAQYASILFWVIALKHFFFTHLVYARLLGPVLGISSQQQKQQLLQRFVNTMAQLDHHTLSTLLTVQIFYHRFVPWISDYFDCYTPYTLASQTVWMPSVALEAWRLVRSMSYSLYGQTYLLAAAAAEANVPELSTPFTAEHLSIMVYSYQLAYYAFGIILLLFIHEKREDFRVMVVHHFAAIVLIALSGGSCLRHPGLMVMFFHDFTDVFLYTFKVARYAKLEVLAKVSFLLLLFTFIFTRIGLMTYYLVMHYLYLGFQVPPSPESLAYASDSSSWSSFRVPIERILYAFMCALVLCQCYWSKILVSVGFSALSGKKIRDPREPELQEEEEALEEEEQENKQHKE